MNLFKIWEKKSRLEFVTIRKKNRNIVEFNIWEFLNNNDNSFWNLRYRRNVKEWW